MRENTKFLLCASGIFVCYFYFGILQEKITRGRYGDDLDEEGNRGEKYTCTMSLVFVQCVVNYLFARGMLLFWPQTNDTVPKVYYASSALTYLLAMVSSNMALRWVPYPTQVVGKAAKPIPVMLLGVLISNKKYALTRYLCVLLIVIGVCLFMYKDGAQSKSVESSGGIGELLLIMSLAMDGLTGAIQERMRSHSSPSAQQMMVAMNGWSVIFLAFALLGGGEAMRFVAFANKFPILIGQLAALAIAGALGQLFIFMTVSEFGPLACSVVTTTRKFFTVLCSVVLFGNALSYRQWGGAVLVFSGLFMDMLYGKTPKKTKQGIPLLEEKKLLS